MPGTTVSIQDLHVDIAARSVARAGAPIYLDPVEWALLEILLLAGGQPVHRHELLPRISGAAFAHDDAFLLVAVWRLRHKLERDPAKPALIKTTREGYRLDPCAESPCACLSAPLGSREGDLADTPPHDAFGP